MKFYHLGGGKASVGFDPDWIRTLVSMATDNSHRVVMGKTASSHFLGLTIAGQNDYCDTITFVKNPIAILLLLQLPIAILLRLLLGAYFA